MQFYGNAPCGFFQFAYPEKVKHEKGKEGVKVIFSYFWYFWDCVFRELTATVTKYSFVVVKFSVLVHDVWISFYCFFFRFSSSKHQRNVTLWPRMKCAGWRTKNCTRRYTWDTEVLWNAFCLLDACDVLRSEECFDWWVWGVVLALKWFKNRDCVQFGINGRLGVTEEIDLRFERRGVWDEVHFLFLEGNFAGGENPTGTIGVLRFWSKRYGQKKARCR